MHKPEDYSTYFNPDGSEKENPYDAFRDIKETKDMRAWWRRQDEMAYSLMTDEEKAEQREIDRNWKDKVQSSVGCAIIQNEFSDSYG